MARHLRTATAVTTGLALVAVSAAVAFANIPDQADIDDGAAAPSVSHAYEGLIPGPVSGVPLFVADASGPVPACVTETDVIRRLNADRDRFGGETVMLSNGLVQAFADEWRRETHLQKVAVSGVFAHVFGEEDAASVDVIELDAKGCALSRTMLSEDDWRFLLRQTVGAEA
jgi:hypothetical protein